MAQDRMRETSRKWRAKGKMNFDKFFKNSFLLEHSCFTMLG